MARITLCNNTCDVDNDNVILFDNNNDLRDYFITQENSISINDVNFDAKNIIDTDIYFQCPNNLSFIDMLNYNYCIVKIDNEYLYFWVMDTSQESGSMIHCKLKIDPFNTYYYKINNLQGLIVRSHLDRFIKYSGDYVYNFAKDSYLFEREKIKNVSKRVNLKVKLNPIYDSSSNTFDNWIRTNVDHWIYYYISDKTYTYYSADNTEIGLNISLGTIQYFKFASGQKTDGGIVCLCAPVYKTEKRIKISYELPNQTTGSTSWDEQAIKDFINKNGGYSFVYSIKHSIQAPFYPAYLNPFLSTDSSGNLIYHNGGGTSIPYTQNGNTYYEYFEDCIDFLKGSTEDRVLGRVIYQDLSKYVRYTSATNLYKAKFTGSELINGSTYHEPKIYNEDYSTYRIIIAGQTYDLPVSKTSNHPYFMYYEPLVPDITKGIMIFNPTDEDATNYYGVYEVFSDDTKSDYTGFAFTVDLSMWYTTDKLDEYLASNKNYLQIFNNNIMSKNLQTGANTLDYIIENTIIHGGKGAIIGAISGINAGTNMIINEHYERENLNLTLDNMAQAPDSLSKINSNIMLIQSVADLGVYLELLQPLDAEQTIIKDYMKLFGYSVNSIGNIDSYIKTRVYYNYIQAEIYDIEAQMSESIKERFKEIFRKGIRFWHYDNFNGIDYSLNNIERSIT